ncbi:Zn-dependent alcohol dehydrogenase [Legionella oakridgensis ATCC 33761 = DSM 21215]|uniref:Zn-dependent alcohol dehydrogenase n=2 Tax=Legionella oakridgensis TaxID=29423 RepID=W0B8M6_9GAMM|nr:Zn-dependent alcohol dehydrogenase [Legionella oakridgensis ATCC 33761 = DSM 21215]KTD39770.1 hypothetical protein Loak_0877 [Legionella oakridgensis]STY19991.1 alcohol dehydrogenase [Legionella longbeachae]
MFAMLMEKPGQSLKCTKLEKPHPTSNELLIKVTACGICRTDLHVVDGDLKHPKLPPYPRTSNCGHY